MKKILIIDDTPEVREMVAAALEISDFVTLSAENGPRGLEMALQHHPDLIVCDVNMPEVDGFETLIAIRQNEAIAHIPFIFLTGVGDKSNMRRGRELGAAAYLTKPFTFDEILQAVNTALKEKPEDQPCPSRVENRVFHFNPHRELDGGLQSVTGIAALMREESAPPIPAEEARVFAENIFNTGQKLRKTLANVLCHYQIEVVARDANLLGTLRSAERRIVKHQIHEAASAVAERFGRASDLRVELGNEPFAIQGELLQKLLAELLDNAFRYSRSGTAVELKTQRQRNLLSIILADRGFGIPAEKLRRLSLAEPFDPFQTTGETGGWGLRVARGIAELFGGACLVESRVGEGTTVQVTFPAQ